MRAFADTRAQIEKRGAIRLAIFTAFDAFDPQSINVETIESEVVAEIPGVLSTDLNLVIGEMCGSREILFGQEDFTYESSPGIFETEVIIAYRLNKTWNADI